MRLRPLGKPFQLSLGERGEIFAAEVLVKKGYKILEKNFRCPLGEIDLVAEKSGKIIFVEVKARHSVRYGSPEEAVSIAKQKKIVRLAQWYLKQTKQEHKKSLFQVIAVDWQKDSPEIRHIENAFSLESHESE